MLALGQAETYLKNIRGENLKITAPVKKRVGKKVNFYSHSQKKQVLLTYGKTKIKAAQASVEETQNRIFLKGGFYSQYLDNEIIGQDLIYNPLRNFFDAKNVTVKSKHAVSQAESFSYYGEKITLKKASFGLDLLKLDIDFEQLDLYPGWVVAYGSTPKFFDVPFFYIPVLVEDKRRNSYRLPDPLPEAGKTFQRGDYWRWNSHYYLNDSLYGAWQFGRAQEKGAGYGLQQIVRLSDYDQISYSNQNWQYDNTQENISYEHSFIELPRKAKQKFTFNELLRYNEEIADMPANRLQINKTIREEVNEQTIDRFSEILYEGNFRLPFQKLRFYTKNSYATIEELSSVLRATKFQSVSQLERDLEVPWFGKFTPGVGYDTSKYSLPPFNWHRSYDYLYGSREFWIFQASGRVTDYLDERGDSPFIFDQFNELSDNIKTSHFMNIWAIQIGRTDQYHTRDGKIFDIIYHFKYRASWTLKVDYSKIKELWAASVELDIF